MLYFREAGAGEPVLLLHGLFGSAENLGGINRALSEHFQTIAFDLPGHGRSQWRDELTLPALAQTFAEWLGERGAEPVRVVGHSLGGKVAMELALRHPELVSQLAVLDVGPQAYRGGHEALFEAMANLPLDQFDDRAAIDAALAEQVAVPAVRSFLLKNLVRGEAGFQWRLDLNGLHRAYPRLIGSNSTGVFAQPTLFLRGGASNYLPVAAPVEVTERFPQFDYRTIAGAGHWLHAEEPSQVANQLLEFFNR